MDKKIEKGIIKINSKKVLDLNEFKTKKCNFLNKHKINNCFFFHNKNDKRRNIIWYEYKSIKCKNNCFEKKCKYSHNDYEKFYHPDKYKKQFCIKHFTNWSCNNKFCNFAHSVDELKIKILHKNYKFNYNFFIFHFKSEFCPFGSLNHNKYNCIYAHNFQDLKRHYNGNFFPKKCDLWKKNYTNENYKNYCKNGYNCKFCHGWKEINYHPLIYKTTKCNYSKKNCEYGLKCPYWHSDNEKRSLQIENNNNTFNFVPKKYN